MTDVGRDDADARARLRAAQPAAVTLAPASETQPLQADAAFSASTGTLAVDGEVRDCAVCMTSPRSVVLTACGHAVLCQLCLEELMLADTPKCPICATAILREPGAWLPLRAAAALAPAATFMPIAVNPEVAAAAAEAAQPQQITSPDALLHRVAALGAAPVVSNWKPEIAVPLIVFVVPDAE